MAWLGVYPDREAVFRSANLRLSRTKVDAARYRRIQALLARTELQGELESLTSRSQPYSDFEEVFILLRGREFRFVCREVAPQGAVLDLLREIRAVGAFRLGDRPFAGPTCTSEPPNSALQPTPTAAPSAWVLQERLRLARLSAKPLAAGIA
jgi:hypothetical protein